MTHDTPPKRIWIAPVHDQWRRGTGEWMAEFWGLPTETPYILASEADALIAEAEARGMERAVHVIPHYFAVYSATGVHIGVWEDGQIAGEVLTEYAGGSIVEMVPISAIRADTAAIRRAAEETGT